MTPQQLPHALAELEARGLARLRQVRDAPPGAWVRIDGRDYLSFASNDYLGLANHPEIVQAVQLAAARHGVGAGAAHLLGGHHRLHHQAEHALAARIGLPAALLFGSGYMANLGVLPALLDRHSEVFADRLNHASLLDAARLSRARLTRYPHLDLATLARQLAASQARTKLIATDTVFSMDGDLAPVGELLALAQRHDAWLYLDDAHGFGVLGEAGAGALAEPAATADPARLIYLATLGKAVGVAGACVAGSETLIRWLVSRARTYVYSTAAPPMLAAGVLASLRLIAAEPWRRAALAERIGQFRRAATGLPWRLLPSASPIQPLLLGDTRTALAVSERLRAQGILIPAIRPPTVPEGTARLRISLTAGHHAEHVERLILALQHAADA